MATVKVKVSSVPRPKVNGSSSVTATKRPKLHEIRPVAS